MLGLFGLVGIYSCGPENTENDVTFTVTASNENPAPGDTITLTVKASAETEDLTEVSVEVQVEDSTSNIQKLVEETEDASGLEFTKDYQVVVPASVKAGEEIRIIVESTDNIDLTASEQFTIKVASYMSIFRADAVMGHRWGPLNGAYDLKSGLDMYQSDPAENKDIIDNSEQNQELSQEFRASTESGSQFIDLGKSYSLTVLNSNTVKSVFEDKTPSTTILISEGSKILVKLRGTEEYVAVHVKSIEPDFDENNTTENDGRYIFDIYQFR